MKKCPKCSYVYSDKTSRCPECDSELIDYEYAQEAPYKTLYNSLKNSAVIDWANKHFSFNLKLYKALIICVIFAIAIVFSYFIGTLKHYADYDVYQRFQENKEAFESLTDAQSTYDQYQSDKSGISNQIDEFEKKIADISDFEANKDNRLSEIQDLESQFNDLTSQKAQKEKTLNDIEYELSQY